MSIAKNSTKTQELINVTKINIGHHVVEAVSARELYIGIGLDQTHWKRWSSKNIRNNGWFLENSGWVKVIAKETYINQPLAIKASEKGNFAEDFYITIDFAKHLSMMAKTNKGHEYREYFIRVEKNALQQALLKNNSEWKQAVKDRKQSHAPMQAVKKAALENEGYKVTNGEFIKENYFCARALTGKWESLEDKELDTYDNKLLAAIRLQNIYLIARYGKKQEKRKELLDQFVADYRAKNPKQNLIEETKTLYLVNQRINND